MSPSNTTNDWIWVGTLMKPYGLKGEIKVRPETFDAKRHSQLKRVLVRRKTPPLSKKLSVSTSRYHQDLWYLRFEGHPTPESVKPYSGSDLFVAREDRLPPPENTIYTSEIIGYQVLREEDVPLGKVEDVSDTGTQDLIHVKIPGKRETVLIPWSNEFVSHIDEEGKTIRVRFAPLEGLYED